MVLDMVFPEVDAAEACLRALREALEATGPSFIVPADPRLAAPVKARATDAVRSLRATADALVRAGLTEG